MVRVEFSFLSDQSPVLQEIHIPPYRNEQRVRSGAEERKGDNERKRKRSGSEERRIKGRKSR